MGILKHRRVFFKRDRVWIKTNTQLSEALAQPNFRVPQRMFTSRQVALIFEYLGEP